ncbi:MAG: 6-pyruvoyl-tetrahydropterin synthase-related protein [Patescibacteria group bacterium]|nr:6-pyruvoyl-tetrahydropterin synthase-related protein [Patescibacteria group bacterium]
MEQHSQKISTTVSILLILFLWIFVCFPLFGQRFIPTHDGEYHLIRIYEFSKMLREGYLFPRWAPGLNSGYGFPLFIFHYPFPNYVGSLFHVLGFSLVQSFQLSLALGVLVGSLGCYFFLKREIKNTWSSLVGTLLFLTIPYLYVDLYVRGSIGEIWAIAWVWCCFASIPWGKKFLFAIFVCLLILSHNIMAMLMLPCVVLYMFLFARRYIVFGVLGILMASYFWIPALVERQYVVGLNTVTYSDHFPELIQLFFPSWGSNFSQPGLVANEMSQQIGIIPLCVILFSFFIWMIKKTKRMLFFLFISSISFFFLLKASAMIWESLPLLQYVQYPWRFLSFFLITVPFLGASIARKSLKIGTILVIASFILSYPYARPVTYEPRDDSYYLTKPEFTDGTSSMGNSFSTIWTSWIPQRASNVVTGNGYIEYIEESYLSVIFKVKTESSERFRVHKTYYPGWEATVNGKIVPINFSHGVIDIDLPSFGVYEVQVMFKETTTRQIANLLSLIGLFSLLVLVILNRYYGCRN